MQSSLQELIIKLRPNIHLHKPSKKKGIFRKMRSSNSRLKKIISYLGPGFITGASDDDPSGIATYAQTGAQFGYTQLWTAPFSFPFMVTVQEMCGRIGMVTGKGLSGVIRAHYSRKILYFIISLLLLSNIINIGANIAAMASSARLFIDLPQLILLSFFTLLSLTLIIFIPYKTYVKYLKYIAFSLLAYVVAVFFVEQDWKEVSMSVLLPQISVKKEYLLNIVAVLGTTISPYLFFWQAGEEVEEEVENHKIRMMGQGIPRINRLDIRKMRIDTLIGMGFSNIVMFFLITIFASTLHVNEIFLVETADQAASALKPFAGDAAFVIFALGIIGTGMLAIPVLAGSASYAVSEAFGWRAGLNQKIKKALGFYAVIIIATVIGVLTSFFPISPFRMLYYTAVLNGMISPILLFFIIKIANNKSIMRSHTNGMFSNVSGSIITIIMGAAAILLVVTMIV